MIAPIIIYPESLIDLKRGTLEYKLWFNFFATARLYGLIITCKEHEEGIRNLMSGFIQSADPWWRHYEPLRKLSPFSHDCGNAKELEEVCRLNGIENLILIKNIIEFNEKDAEILLQKSVAFACTKKQDIKKVENFLRPLLTFSLDIRIWDRFLHRWGNGKKDKIESFNFQFYTFTVRKILEWTQTYNLLIRDKKSISFTITTEFSSPHRQNEFSENFKDVLDEVSSSIDICIDVRPAKKGSQKDQQPLDRYIAGSIKPYNKLMSQDNVIAAKVAHGFNFLKIMDAKLKNHPEYYYKSNNTKFEERYNFPNDFCITPDSFHPVSSLDFHKISSYL